ncbi:N-terminal double-transmembrane domain-containing protein [Meinhardsimonia xiamenensis]|jgi:hypothetical protein|uniref:N-terminal double-transmembrane domain-containing protein n=1 Tax=Meinhardsimonia xiamenensis TaxID=990712 RepID=A0A1G8Y073_9RHOB|nr:DUF4159 domain-containing protein [Meinhardsimonia xiamenensis]PRX37116.1 putative membrane protein (TIGR02226 family) [Meinhardsimonia xiamenensis]SDJ96176.1 N-terminal double-transmembrane domain-containing protein [Meinhardsimonia xiamenensis]
MFMLGPIGFTAPWILAALAALPILWLLLRAVPPAPIRRRFPGVALLLGLTDDETQTDRTPWWLLMLRTLAVAALILGFAGPVLNPQERTAGSGPLLILADASWASARDWPRRLERIEVALDEAGRDGRPVAVVTLTDLPAGPPAFQAAGAWAGRLAALAPKPWEPDMEAAAAWAGALEGGFETFWLSDGLAREGREALLAALQARGGVRVFEDPRPVLALRPPVFDGGTITLSAVRSRPGAAAELELVAQGRDPLGVERELARATLAFAEGAREAEVALSLPGELRNRISRFELAGIRSAGAVSLTDDALRRREVALIAARTDREGLELLSPLYYLRKALVPTADVIEGGLADVLPANPDVIVLADVAKIAEPEAEALRAWVEAGGLLLRFAGPQLAASDVSRAEEDPLMPVRLRAGGRTVGGAMSWGEPKRLRPFAEGSPFYGLAVPDDVTVRAQVLAQPDPELAGRVIATLADGTPLVTRKRMGAGQVVLFHVTANAEWSSLPLSGLFVQMLERLAVSSRPPQPSAEELAGTVWSPEKVLDAFGRIEDAGTLPGVPGERLAEARLGPDLPPGLYAGEERRLAVNVARADTVLAPARWPASVPVEGMGAQREMMLAGPLFAAALMMLMLDILASLWLSGRLGLRPAATVALAALALALPAPEAARAQESEADARAIAATREVTLAHVLTGNARVDEVAAAGLRGLSRVLFQRTSVEPAEPMAVDLERDELAFYPLLYWPVTPDQPLPSAAAYARLNQFLRTGGMIVFDTRDADIARFGASSPNGRALQRLAAALDIPPLEPVPADHVLTRTFYLLQDFPGRHASRDVWVEAAPPDAEKVEGMPFRNLNDNVTPVVIGGNDWAAAWAIDPAGNPMFPVGRGFGGERQRELAYRFGVNLVMHVLTGNYKSDQVHVPALLERLGQ